MKLWPFGKKQEERNIEDPNHAITHETLIGNDSAAGFPVSPETVMRVSAALACVRVLSESVASLSWIVYKRLAAGGKDRDSSHPVYKILHHRPNSLMSSFSFRERVMKDMLLHGNAYCLIDRSQGYPSALWPIDPYKVTEQIRTDKKGIRYQIKTSGGFDGIYRAEDILHIPCLGDGSHGKSVISYNAGSFGIAMAEDEYAKAFFANGAYAGGVLQYQKTLSPEARERLKQGWQNAYGKSGGWHKVAVLEDGIDWKPMTVNPKDAMALESRKFQVSDIARMFRVPPHMIADLDRATFSNIEHQSLEFVMHSLRPWVVRIEQEVNWKLFGESDEEHFSELLLDSMLRGDVKSRNEAYSIMRQNGALNADEWRERENMNPLPDGQGKKYLVQLNMQELSRIGEEEGEEENA